MIVHRRRFLIHAGAVALASVTWGGALAQLAPDRPIKFVLAEAAGSSNDVIARILAPAVSAALGRNVFVENRPGAGTLIGTRTVIQSQPDGHTLLVSSIVHQQATVRAADLQGNRRNKYSR